MIGWTIRVPHDKVTVEEAYQVVTRMAVIAFSPVTILLLRSILGLIIWECWECILPGAGPPATWEHQPSGYSEFPVGIACARVLGCKMINGFEPDGGV